MMYLNVRFCRHFHSSLGFSFFKRFFTKSSLHQNKFKEMDVKFLPALQDNYMYLLIDKASMECAAVDPVEPDTVLAAVKKGGYKLTAILTTHHHWDHAGGNKDLLTKFGQPLDVHGGDKRIDGVKSPVKHGDKLRLGSDLEIDCLFTPCHTTGHICYHVRSLSSGQPGIVFTGDTLFIGGCGRFFEGTPKQMYTALVDVLGQLPDSTQVYCGHEYTVKNLQFAAKVDSGNAAVKTKLAWAEKQRLAGQPTVPSTIGSEKETNPFMRVKQQGLLTHTRASDPVEAMKVLRAEKDCF